MDDRQLESATPPDEGAPQHDPANKNRARLTIVVVAVMWSSAGFLAQAPVFKDWCDPFWRGTVQAFWRSLFAAAVLIPFVRRPRWDVRLIPMMLCFAAMTTLYLSAINLTTAANAIWLQATAPAWVFLVGVFWYREAAIARDWRLLLLCMLGIGMILAFEIVGDQLPGVSCGLLSGVTFAGIMLLLRRLREYDSGWLIALNHIATAIILLPLVIWQGEWPTAPQWPYLIALGVFQLGIPYLLFARSVRVVPSHEASCIALLEPVLVPVWVFLAWGYMPRWWTILGGSLILAGLLLRYLPRGGFRKT
jgi:DME family drug/metabolite transporter